MNRYKNKKIYRNRNNLRYKIRKDVNVEHKETNLQSAENYVFCRDDK